MKTKSDKVCASGKAMQIRPLGNIGIPVTVLGFGCAAAWGKSVMNKPMISDSEAQFLFEKAYELGIRYYDTGFNYGFAEERIGKILKRSSVVKREDIIISTKFGERFVDDKWKLDWSPEWMRESLYTSMERMGIDYVDILMCHGGSKETLSSELIGAMRELKDKGIVKSIGINTFNTKTIKWVLQEKAFDVVMLDYNILKQDREPLIKELYEAGIGVIAGCPLAESLYSNRIFKIRKTKDLWYLARALKSFRKQFFKGRKFTFINRVDGMSGSQIALKYVLDNPYVSTAVFGTTTPSHLKSNVEANDITIPKDVLARIKAIG